MATNLVAAIQADIKQSMIAKDKLKTTTLRMLMASIKQIQVDRGAEQRQDELSDAEIMSIINKMIQQRREAAKQYTEAGSAERAEQELVEIKVLEAYLPEQLSDAEIEAEVQAAIKDTGAAAMQDMGKVMALLRDKLAGSADMSKVSKAVKRLLNS